MLFKDFKKEICDKHTDVYCNLSDDEISVENITYTCEPPGCLEHAEPVARISTENVGNYQTFKPINRRNSRLIRKFANTPIKERKQPVDRHLVAIIGKDIGGVSYTAYFRQTEGGFWVSDSAGYEALCALSRFHFSDAEKSTLLSKLDDRNLPKPQFVEIDELQDYLEKLA